MEVGNFLKTVYHRDEAHENAYPQKLVDQIIKTIIEPFFTEAKGKKVLDIGSGSGMHLVGFRRRGFDVYGLDKRDECVQVLDDFDIRSCDVETEPFPFESNSFDIAYSMSVIEHITDTSKFITEVIRILKPGGLAIIMCPDWVSHRYKSYWDDYTHVRVWTRKSLQNALVWHGFNSVECVLFRQLPILWKYPFLSFLSDLTSLLPESFKWKDKQEMDHRAWIRFSKEKMLLATASKPTDEK
jgi:SAM-dependent methyltransferase